MTDASQRLYARNHKAFEANHPDVWKRLSAITRPVTSLVETDGVIHNIDLGAGELYPIPAPDWARQQLNVFYDQPDRIIFSDPSHCNLSVISLKLLGEITHFIRKRRWRDHIGAVPVIDVGYLFVFGIGLGHHIEELIAKTPSRVVALIEPIEEFLLHSLSVVDWGKVFRIAKRRGITIRFVLDKQPHDIARRIESFISEHGNTFLDGSYYCPHYYSWTLQEAYALLQEQLKHFFISSGFFEDELAMVRHTHQNLKRWPFRLLEGKPHLEQHFPVFVIGSGPSLDKDLPYIRKWREHAIVFSCGTALRPLLRAGIRPDFHFELEREEVIPGILERCRAESGLHDITLVASTTIWPDIGGLFDKRCFYFRSGLSPSKLMNAGASPLVSGDPLVTNSAFAAATNLGFRNIYLFGVDSGQKEKGLHHAKDSPYYLKENLDLEEECRDRYDRVVPGNFGGTVKTFWAFDIGRRLLAEVQLQFRTNLFNCSDGARIVGAEPKLAAAIDLSDGPTDRHRVLAQVEGQMRHFEAGAFLAETDYSAYIKSCDTFLDAFTAFTKCAHADESFWDVEMRLRDFLNTNEKELAGVLGLALNSMRSMNRLGAFFGNRLKDARKRRAIIKRFADSLHDRCVEMAAISKELFTEIEEDQSRFLAENLKRSA